MTVFYIYREARVCLCIFLWWNVLLNWYYGNVYGHCNRTNTENISFKLNAYHVKSYTFPKLFIFAVLQRCFFLISDHFCLPSQNYCLSWVYKIHYVDGDNDISNEPLTGALTHWGRMTHICVGKLTVIGSDNCLSPERRQAIIRTNVGILLIGPLGTNFSEFVIAIHTCLFNKMHLKMSSAKWRPFVSASMC